MIDMVYETNPAIIFIIVLMEVRLQEQKMQHPELKNTRYICLFVVL